MLKVQGQKDTIIICPDCGSDAVYHIKPYSDTWKHEIGNDQALIKQIHETYGSSHSEDLIACRCHDDYKWKNYDEDEDKYYGLVEGLTPLKHVMLKNISKPKDPEIEKLCNYPDKCYCGECPNPDQLEFDLKGASKEWWR